MKLYKCLLIALVLTLFQNLNAQWSDTGGPPSRSIQCFTVSDSNIIAGTNGGMVRSTNNGSTWVSIGSGQNTRTVLYVSSYPFNVLAGTMYGGILKSSDYGSNWNGFPVDSVQLPYLAHVNSILERQNSSEFWVGTDRGAFLLPQYYPLSSWIPVNDGLPSVETKVRSIIEKDGEIFAGTNGGVFQLNGYSWDEKNSGLTNTNVTALSSTNGYLIAGTSQGSIGGVYISADNGGNWTLVKNDAWVASIITIGPNIFVGSFGDGVWRSTNNGSTWGQINDGLSSGAYYVLSLAANDQYIYAGTNNSNVWRRPLSQVVTDTEEETNLQPKEFSLNQNYPNPFNPSTTIQYQVSSISQVSLKVFNSLGEEVAELVNETKPAGNYSVSFDASKLTSGVYFYKINAESFVETKKMILVK
jgi:hypothetical protein